MSVIDPARTTVKQDFMKKMRSLKKNLEHEKKVKASKTLTLGSPLNYEHLPV
jgi:hypothetical protein